MAVNGKGKQVASEAPAASSSSKRKKPVPQELLDRRKKRKPGVLQFFDVAAEDADFEDEDEEEDEEEENDFDSEDEFADLGSSKGGTSMGKDYKSSGKGYYLPFLVKEEELSGDELEENLRNRYGRGSAHVVYNEDAKDYDDGDVVEHTNKDPNVWRVKCTVGREQHFAICLMHKYADLQRRGIKMEIVSAFTLEHVKGYVYIEADKEHDVVEACKGFLNIYPSRRIRVPKNEIPTLFSFRNKPCGIPKGTWIRMKSGNYKGDLGQVVDYDETRRKATIKLVPRIDLQAIAKKFGGGISLKGAAVPASRLISSHELEHFRPHIKTIRDRHSGDTFEVLDGLLLKDGYLYKKVSITSIVYWGVQPSKDELLKFTETSKTEEEDLSWLSSVFTVRKKTKPSNDTHTEATSEHGSSFNLHDLVLYGKKGFGVIVDIGKDGIKILKENPDVQEVMTIKCQDIKTKCVDKMFTACDRKKKTIYINDVAKVLGGPLEGREGIVKHMYKGTLFLYDENQEENSGIFCIKSDSCENTTSPKDSLRKAGSKSSSSFNQSSFELDENEDGSRSFSRNQHESNQIFSIGQTLRIRKGPLKGYLCHVMGIYRADVTVKLGSLGKVLTVQEQHLSVPNVKRDISTEAPSDCFGVQGTGSTWEALNTSTIALSSDQNADQGGSDPWASKPVDGISAGQAADPWGSSSAVASAEQAADPWASSGAVASAGQAADPWGSSGAVVSAAVQATDPWGSSVAVASAGQESAGGCDPWAIKPASGNSEKAQVDTDPWGSTQKASAAEKAQAATDSWDNTQKASADQGGSEPWGINLSSGPSEKAKLAMDPWGSAQKASVDQGGSDPWSSKLSSGPSAEKAQVAGDPWGSAQKASADQGGSNPWDSKLLSGTRAEKAQVAMDPWDSARKASADQGGSDPYDSKLSSGPGEKSQAATDPWGGAQKTSTEKTQVTTDPWGSAQKASADQGVSNPWDSKLSSVPSEKAQTGTDPWGNAKKVSAEKAQIGTDPWGSAQKVSADQGGCDPWGSKLSSGPSEKPQVANDPWGSVQKASVEKSQVATDPWGTQKASVEIEQDADPWGSKAATGSKDKEQGAVDPWGSSVPSKASGGSESGWGTESSTKNETNAWSKPVPFGEDNKSDQKDSWDNPNNFEGGRGFGGRGRGRFGNRDNDEDNNNSSDFGGGGWGFGERGRGRGRGGRYGNRQNDGDNYSSGFGGGGGWGSGERGRGGRFGNRDGDQDNRSRGGWSSGGRGRGGRFQSSDGGNNNNDFGGSSWGKSKGSDDNQPAEKKDWGASKPSGDGEPSFGDWNKSSGGRDSWDKSKGVLGEPPSKMWNANEEAGAGKWNSKPETKQSSGWGGNDNGGSDWSKPKTSRNDDGNYSNFDDDNGGSSFGGRGRSDSFRGGRGPRGGRGRNFNGGGWGNLGSGDQSENSSGFGGGGQSSWNSGGGNSSWGKKEDANIGNEGGGNWGSGATDAGNGGGSGSGWNAGTSGKEKAAASGWGDAGSSAKKDDSGWGSKGGW